MELILNVTVFVSGSGEGNVEKLIMNISVFFRVWEEQYREEMVLNFTVCVSWSGKSNIERN